MTLLGKFFVIANLGTLAWAQSAITVDVSSQQQEVHGFGFSQAFGRAKEFQNADPTLQKQALDYLFDTTTGAGFSIIRNRIGSGGAGDSIEPTSPGSATGTPSYTFDNDDSGQVWFSQQAVSYGVKTIYADAWSAPGFMKTSGNEATAGYLCGTTGHTCSSGDWKQAYADFLVQYVKYYAEANISVTHLGFLNEPDYSPSYSQMQISSNAKEAISFIPVLSAAVKSAGLSLSLTCCDAVGWSSQSSYTNSLVAGKMEQYLGVITSHMYSSDANSPINTKLPTWITEAGSTGSASLTATWHSNGGINEGMTWANKIATGIINAHLSAYLFWEGFEIGQTQSASHLIDNKTLSGPFWAFAMWSRYIRPGAYRVATSGSASGVLTGAFKNTDGSVVVVFTNGGSSAQSTKVSFSGFSPGSASAWLTDNSNKFASTTATLSSGAVTVSIPSQGVVTVKLSAGNSSATAI